MKLLRILVSMVAALSGSAAMTAAHTPTTAEEPGTLGGLVRLCERDDDVVSRLVCVTYISGFLQGSQAIQDAAIVRALAEQIKSGTTAPTHSAAVAAASKVSDESRLFCIRRSSSPVGHVQALVVQYGREHRDGLKEPTRQHMLKILQKASPAINQSSRYEIDEAPPTA